MLRCDSFDLYQLHAVTDVDELDARAGALTAILAARDEGLCRFVGITGHNLTTPAAQLEALRRYDLDTVMFPVNPRLWADPAYRHDAEALLGRGRRRDDVGSWPSRRWPPGPGGSGPTPPPPGTSPTGTPPRCAGAVHFALSVPGVHALCGPGDTDVLPLAIEAARTFVPMGSEARREASWAVAGERMIFPIPGA